MHRKGLVWMGWVGALGCIGALPACDGLEASSAAEGLADAEARSEVGNAQVLNSAVLNGIQFNGIQFNGIQFNGIQFNGIQFNGIQFNGIQFNNSALTGTIDLGGGPVQKTGADFIGAEMLLAGNGTTYTLRFDDIFLNPAQPGAGVYFHKISVRDDAVGTWSSLCHDPAGAPTEAILLLGTWDGTTGARVDNSQAITFACRHAVLAKCVEWGYVPWKTATQCEGKTCSVVSLRDHHQACTRMARADYCGDGRSYTFNGTPIDLYDKLKPNLQLRTTQSDGDWTVEAEWGADGVTCIGDALRMAMYDDHQLPYTFPSCIADRWHDHCGDFKGRPASRLANAYCDVWESNPATCDPTNDDRRKH